MSRRRRLTVETASGPVTISAQDEAIVGVTWTHGAGTHGTGVHDAGGRGGAEESPLLQNAAQQLHDYFAGTRCVFDLPLRPAGSDFYQAVWREMLAIPYGETRSYGDLARATGGNARAVGTACGANPIPIFIPCHRVLAADRQLGGFSGGKGTETKAFLLTLEGSWPVQHSLPFA